MTSQYCDASIEVISVFVPIAYDIYYSGAAKNNVENGVSFYALSNLKSLYHIKMRIFFVTHVVTLEPNENVARFY